MTDDTDSDGSEESSDGDPETGQNQYGGGEEEIDAVEQTERMQDDEDDADDAESE